MVQLGLAGLDEQVLALVASELRCRNFGLLHKVRNQLQLRWKCQLLLQESHSQGRYILKLGHPCSALACIVHCQLHLLFRCYRIVFLVECCYAGVLA